MADGFASKKQASFYKGNQKILLEQCALQGGFCHCRFPPHTNYGMQPVLICCTGSEALKELSLKIQRGFMSLDSNFDCYGSFIYISGMSNIPGIWSETAVINR